ncbi:MAG TPA: site-specific integrase [Acidimicrobiia bacterium]|jgi:integrase
MSRSGWIEDRHERGLRWRARYRGPDGLIRSKSFATKVRAQRWLTDQLANIDRATWVTPEHGQIPWEVYSGQLLAGRVHLAARTIETDRRCHERAAEWIGDVSLARLTPELVRRMTSELSERYAAATVARTMRWVRLTLNQAVRDRRILSSPAAGVRLPRSRRSEMRLLDPAEVRELAGALPDRYGSLAIAAAYTGLRWGELAGLGVRDIDMLRRRLTVRATLVEASSQAPRLGPPKSAASERTVTLPVFVVETLARHLEAHPAVDGMVWTTDQGGFLRRGSFGRIWRKAVAESIGPPCRIHDLRHTHAAWLIADGEHPKAIQTRLGHGSISVTMDRYGHLMDGLDDQIAAHLDARAGSAAPPARPETPEVTAPIDLQTRRNP